MSASSQQTQQGGWRVNSRCSGFKICLQSLLSSLFSDHGWHTERIPFEKDTREAGGLEVRDKSDSQSEI